MEAIPKVYNFTDYRVYLRRFYEWKKANEPGFSYATFAERAGLQSRSYPRLVISGKRNLTPDTVSSFVTAMSLSHSEGEAFSALVHFNQAANFEARSYYWNQFVGLIPKNSARQTLADEYLFLSRNANPIILNMLRQKDIKKDFESLMKATGLNKSQLSECLETLKKLNLIQQIGSESFIATETVFCTKNDVPSIAIQRFHNTMLGKAQEALSLPVQEREFQALTFALSNEEFTYIRKRLRDLAEELDKTFSRGRTGTEKIYVVNMNVIPVTDFFIRGESSSQKQRADHVNEAEV